MACLAPLTEKYKAFPEWVTPQGGVTTLAPTTESHNALLIEMAK